jgi:hypothetical protein
VGFNALIVYGSVLERQVEAGFVCIGLRIRSYFTSVIFLVIARPPEISL